MSAIVKRNVLILPNLSHASPEVSRPTAMQALKHATTPADTELERPGDLATVGKRMVVHKRRIHR